MQKWTLPFCVVAAGLLFAGLMLDWIWRTPQDAPVAPTASHVTISGQNRFAGTPPGTYVTELNDAQRSLNIPLGGSARVIDDTWPDILVGLGADGEAVLAHADRGRLLTAADAIVLSPFDTARDNSPLRAPFSRLSQWLQGRDRPLVLIDPGHGGAENGALADSGYREADINLLAALELCERLVSRDVACELTRARDETLSLRARLDRIGASNATIFVSLHTDSAPNRSAAGVHLYTLDPSAGMADQAYDTELAIPPLVDAWSRRLAQAVAHELSDTAILAQSPVRRADFGVLKSQRTPSILVELGFLSNPADAERVIDARVRKTVLDAIAEAIGANIALVHRDIGPLHAGEPPNASAPLDEDGEAIAPRVGNEAPISGALALLALLICVFCLRRARR